MVTGTYEGGGRDTVVVEGRTYRCTREVKFLRGERKTFPDGRAGFDPATRSDFKPGCQVALHGVHERPEEVVVEGAKVRPVPPNEPEVHSIRWLGEPNEAWVNGTYAARRRDLQLSRTRDPRDFQAPHGPQEFVQGSQGAPALRGAPGQPAAPATRVK